MRSKQNVCTIANCFANCTHHLFRQVHGVQRWLTSVVHRVAACWVELHSRETAFHFAHCTFGSSVWIAVHRIICIHIDTNWRIQVCVSAEFFVHATTEQFVNRLASFLAANVPHSHFQTGNDSASGEVWAMCIATAIHVAPHVFDMKRIGTNDVSCGNFFCHFRYQMRRIRSSVNFTDSGDAGIGSELYENEVTTTESWRWITHHECLDVDDFHTRKR